MERVSGQVGKRGTGREAMRSDAMVGELSVVYRQGTDAVNMMTADD